MTGVMFLAGLMVFVIACGVAMASTGIIAAFIFDDDKFMTAWLFACVIIGGMSAVIFWYLNGVPIG